MNNNGNHSYSATCAGAVLTIYWIAYFVAMAGDYHVL
jgi:hypothetical protein